MSITVNVNGELKKLTRIFFNDNGVIREFDSVYTRNGNEIKPIFTRDYKIPGTLSWIAETISGVTGTIYSVTNNGYTLRVRCVNKKRCIATSSKVYLPAGTNINVEMSNIEYHGSSNIRYHYTYTALFDSESFSDTVQESRVYGTSSTVTVQSSGYYYIAFTGGGLVEPYFYSRYMYDCTADVDIMITLP